MKLIVLFDSDKLDNCYRVYELSEVNDSDLRKGKWLRITICHPDHGEVCIMEAEDHEKIDVNI